MNMNTPDAGLKDLEALYNALEGQLETQYRNLLEHRLPNPAQETEAARIGGQILKAESFLADLMHSTPSGAGTVPVAPMQTRIHHLLEIIERNAAQCRQLQREAQSALQELQRGGQFLQSVRGYRENQPMFLDALK